MPQKVVVLGGGVAGMSAAHELIERGFAVEVYEVKTIPGGKARSIPSTQPGPEGQKPLPGEHGFRFFPRFYKHVTDTMKRIPVGNGRSAFDNLTETSRIGIFQYGKPGLITLSRFPRSLADLKVILNDIFHHPHLGLTPDDIDFFATRIWQLITSCKQRRMSEYERISWWDYVNAQNRSVAYQTWLATGISRSLVASSARYANTFTDGDVLVQLMFDIIEPGVSSDRVLNAPTNDAWLNPWLKYLRQKGVDYQFGAVVEEINFDYTPGKGANATQTKQNPHIKSVTIRQNGETREVSGDYYIMALPVERAADLVIKFPPEVMATDPTTFKGILQLSKNVAWMNGLQFYLKKDVPIEHGHAIYIDSPWALTSISQKQFWPNVDLSKYGDGEVKGILSIDISDWGIYVDPKTEDIEITSNQFNTASLGRFNKKHAFECTPDEIQKEVWEEIKGNLNQPDQPPILTDDDLHSWFMDPDIVSSQVVRWLIEQGDVTADEMSAYLGENLRVATDVLNGLVERGLLHEVEEGGTTHYRIAYVSLIRWLMTQKNITLAQIAQHLGKTEAETQPIINTLVIEGLLYKDVVDGKTVYQPRQKLQHDSNLEPLLINLVDTWHLRPEAFTRIPNLFVASDYVQTNTNLATMEGANEAARRAVNAIISDSGVDTSFCQVWDLHEPWVFSIWRWHDAWRFRRGLPWKEDFPLPIRLLQKVLMWFRNLRLK